MEIKIEGLNEINLMFEEIISRLERLEKAQKTGKTITIKEICEIEGVGLSLIKTSARYLLPRFGESAYPDGVKRWDVEEFYKWRRIPVEERKRMFEEKLEARNR